jgi:hypothetical protein
MVKTVLATDMTHHFEHVNAFKVRFCCCTGQHCRVPFHPPSHSDRSVLFSTAKARPSLGANGNSQCCGHWYC